jgi:orotidine-5'-phosphate decarboxylase
MIPGMSDTKETRLAIPWRERLMVALDISTLDRARGLVQELGDAVTFYKVGLELFLAPGTYPAFLEELTHLGKRVFADLKLYDVPRTVGAAVRQIRNSGVAFCTVHGDDSILQAACQEKGDVGILAVTALTSLDRGDLAGLGFTSDVESLVLTRGRRALEMGCDGLVSSGLEVARLRAALGPGFAAVVPGIRPAGEGRRDDQKRTVDVEEAFRNGADYIVMGRPILGAPDPRAAAEAVQERIRRQFEG